MQDILPTTAQHHGVAVSWFEKYLRVNDIHGAEEFVSHGLNIIQNAGVCAMKLSDTSWPPLAVQCVCSSVLLHTTFSPSMDRVAGMLAEWFSLHERLISQSVSKNISLQLEEELQCEVWDSLEAERWALLSSRMERYCYDIQGNAFDFAEG